MDAASWTVVGAAIAILVAIGASFRSLRDEMRAQGRDLRERIDAQGKEIPVGRTALSAAPKTPVESW